MGNSSRVNYSDPAGRGVFANLTLATITSLLLFLAIPSPVLAQPSQSNCISLRNSQVCGGGWSQYFIHPSVLPLIDISLRDPAFRGVPATLEGIERAIKQYTSPESLRQQTRSLKCSLPEDFVFRYFESTFCASLVLLSGQCTGGSADLTATLCQSTYDGYLSAMTFASANCGPDWLAGFSDLINRLKLTVAPSGACVEATPLEFGTCGFGVVSAATKYCSTNATDPCCSRLADPSTTTLLPSSTASPTSATDLNALSAQSSSSSLSIGAIVGIIIGVLVFTGIVVGAIFVARLRNNGKRTSGSKDLESESGKGGGKVRSPWGAASTNLQRKVSEKRKSGGSGRDRMSGVWDGTSKQQRLHRLSEPSVPVPSLPVAGDAAVVAEAGGAASPTTESTTDTKQQIAAPIIRISPDGQTHANASAPHPSPPSQPDGSKRKNSVIDVVQRHLIENESDSPAVAGTVSYPPTSQPGDATATINPASGSTRKSLTSDIVSFLGLSGGRKSPVPSVPQAPLSGSVPSTADGTDEETSPANVGETKQETGEQKIVVPIKPLESLAVLTSDVGPTTADGLPSTQIEQQGVATSVSPTSEVGDPAPADSQQVGASSPIPPPTQSPPLSIDPHTQTSTAAATLSPSPKSDKATDTSSPDRSSASISERPPTRYSWMSEGNLSFKSEHSNITHTSALSEAFGTRSLSSNPQIPGTTSKATAGTMHSRVGSVAATMGVSANDDTDSEIMIPDVGFTLVEEPGTRGFEEGSDDEEGGSAAVTPKAGTPRAVTPTKLDHEASVHPGAASTLMVSEHILNRRNSQGSNASHKSAGAASGKSGDSKGTFGAADGEEM
ncbi:hypothetical protein HK102_014163 [Quaeritorhiza haematococci]|nr:hypothetical protein HK102_014163 [Quaeritorhiza haematococci]